MTEIRNQLNSNETGSVHRRFRIMLIVVMIALFILALRLWHLQVIKGEELKQKSENNCIRFRKIKPVRGLIMDKHREVLVDNQCSFDVHFVPADTRDIQSIVNRLRSLYRDASLDITHEAFTAGKLKPFMPVKLEKNVSREKLAIVETHTLDLPGVVVDVIPVRKYLGGEMTAHLIGYTGEVSQEELDKDESGSYSSGDLIGKSGIEKHLDAYLRGESGFEQVEVNVLGKMQRVLGKKNPKPGYNVVLTIDAMLQKTAWEALAGKPGAVVAMDPRDGSVLALVSSPTFDPMLFSAGISHENWKRLSGDSAHPMENRAVSGQYPPASTYKLIVAAAALQEGLITPETSFVCNGSYELGNRKYRCWHKGGHGRVNLHRAMVQSCDVFFYNVGKMIGVDKLAEYARRFGLGAQTGIALPREKSGLIPTREWKQARLKEPWQIGETISVSIGQGYNLVTPLQLVTAYSALANGGVVWRPRLIERIEDVDGAVIEAFVPEKKSGLSLSENVMEQLKKALWGVVNEEGGTGRAARRADADVAGKTGTAQVIGLPDNDKARKVKFISTRHRDHAMFVCFAPVNNPEIAIAIIAENAGHGGSAAAPVARKILDAYFDRKESPGKKPPVVISDRRMHVREAAQQQ
ncbi:MAG: penicillin-binding protein 2 [Syntrophus sp. (in: bacteria)]|nr:penicillin-binding protein 2 [Syntrophus sp. (in: bacteria)]